MILAGDIGGTKTVVGLFEEEGEKLRLVREGVFPSRDHSSLEEILEKFLGQQKPPQLTAACFGVAGAVIDGKSETTNLPWHLNERDLAKAVGAPHATLLNDLEAAAYGMLYLAPDEYAVLNRGTGSRRPGNIAVIAAGTGLGEAFLYWDGRNYHPIASEGGHSDFAPRSELEVDLWRYLAAQFGHVSYERVLSGPGFYSMYKFLRDSGRYPESPELAARLQGQEPNPIIGQLGMDRADPLCTAAVDLFSTIYGAEAGNLALKIMAVGGVYVGGGIAPKVLSILQNGTFMRGFTDKGRFSELVSGLEVKVALNARAPLIGAAHYAARGT